MSKYTLKAITLATVNWILYEDKSKTTSKLADKAWLIFFLTIKKRRSEFFFKKVMFDHALRKD